MVTPKTKSIIRRYNTSQNVPLWYAKQNIGGVYPEWRKPPLFYYFISIAMLKFIKYIKDAIPSYINDVSFSWNGIKINSLNLDIKDYWNQIVMQRWRSTISFVGETTFEYRESKLLLQTIVVSKFYKMLCDALQIQCDITKRKNNANKIIDLLTSRNELWSLSSINIWPINISFDQNIPRIHTGAYDFAFDLSDVIWYWNYTKLKDHREERIISISNFNINDFRKTLLRKIDNDSGFNVLTWIYNKPEHSVRCFNPNILLIDYLPTWERMRIKTPNDIKKTIHKQLYEKNKINTPFLKDIADLVRNTYLGVPQL